MNLVESLVKIFNGHGLSYTLKGSHVLPEEFLKEDSLLPALAKRANELCSLCLSYGLGVKFENDKDAVVGYKVSFDDATPVFLRVVFIYDVFWDIARATPKGGTVVLDELLYD